MKVSEFLSEERFDFTSLSRATLYSGDDPREHKKIWETEIVPILEHNCKEILSIYKKSGTVLYRGIKASEVVMVSSIRKDRKTVDLNPKLQELADEVIGEMGGKAKRGNSIFTVVDRNVSGNWGHRYIVFPRDGFDVTFFTKNKAYMFYEIDGMDPSKKSTKEELKKIFTKFGVSFNKGDLAKYMKNTDSKRGYGEVLITGDSYIGLYASVFEDLVFDLVRSFKG